MTWEESKWLGKSMPRKCARKRVPIEDSGERTETRFTMFEVYREDREEDNILRIRK